MYNSYYPPRMPYAAPRKPARPPMCMAAKMLIAALVALAVTVTGSLGALAVRDLREAVHDEWGYDWDDWDDWEEEELVGVPLSPDDPGWVKPARNPNAPKVTLNVPGTQAEALTDAEVAAKVRPSVVGIVACRNDSGEWEAYSEGSGVVLTANGYILTNAHVLESGLRFLVIDYEGNSYNAVPVGSDSRTDLAVIRITDNVNLTPAEFGDSAQVAVGDTVMAIGNPGGMSYASSVTFGHVSAVNRTIDMSVNVFGLLQVDAAINPGNSGGALVNRWGQVIGINCAKVVAEDYEGIGFAIPITKAKLVFDALMEYGYLKDRVWLGISVLPVDTITAALEETCVGIRIVQVVENSVFSVTDVRSDDIIVAMNGTRVTNNAELFEQLYTCKPQQKADFTLYRPSTGKTFTVTVALLGQYE